MSKFGMNMLLWTASVTEEHYPVLEMLKNIGYDGVEVPIFETKTSVFTRLGKELDRLGLERTAVTVCVEGANPISSDFLSRRAGLVHIKESIDMCSACGVKLLCGPMHSALGVFTDKGRTEDEWKWGLETLIAAADYAKQADVLLAIEPLNRFECYFLNCVADTARFCREANHTNLKMMYDTFHANVEEKDVALAMMSCFDQVEHVHISENDRSTPGKGHIHWKSTFQTMKELRYDKWVTVEAFGVSMPQLAATTKIHRKMYDTEEGLARDALAFMKQMMAS